MLNFDGLTYVLISLFVLKNTDAKFTIFQNITDELLEKWYSDLLHAGLFQYLMHTIATVAFSAKTEGGHKLAPFVSIFFKAYTDLKEEVQQLPEVASS